MIIAIRYEFHLSFSELSEEVSIARSEVASYGANKHFYYIFKVESKDLYKKLWEIKTK